MNKFVPIPGISVRFSLALVTLFAGLSTTSALAEGSTVLPPKLDYARLCVQPGQPSVDKFGLKDWRKGAIKAPDEDVFAIANLYRTGTRETPRRPSTAYRLFSYLAAKPRPLQMDAKVMQGKMLHTGEGVKKDQEKAVFLFAEATVRKHPDGIYQLGRSLAKGQGIKKDHKSAANFYAAAAAQDVPQAAIALAYMYIRGSVKQPFAGAVDRMNKLASKSVKTIVNRGDCDALAEIGQMYHRGSSVPKDKKIAFQWHRAAAAAGNKKSMMAMAKYYDRGVVTSKDKKQVHEYWRQAAELGSVKAMYMLGENRMDINRGGESNKIGIAYLEGAAAQGHKGAIKLLIKAYANRRGPDADPERARYWLEIAQEKLPPDAEVYANLGMAQQFGHGGERDFTGAAKNYEKAADLGSDVGLLRLAMLYRNGKGVEQDLIKSLQLLRQAALRDNASALIEITKVYQCGIGIEPNMEKAELWLQRSADRGNSSALQTLIERAEEAGDRKTRAKLIKRMANRGSRTAMVDLAHIYETGDGLPQNQRRAELWKTKSEADGPRQADAFIRQYQNKTADKKDGKVGKEALEYLKKAVKLGNTNAQQELARLHFRNRLENASPETGMDLLRQSAENGDTGAMRKLYQQLRAEPGPEAAKEAREWLKKSAKSPRNVGANVDLATSELRGDTGEPEAERIEKLLDRVETQAPCNVPDVVAFAKAQYEHYGPGEGTVRANFWLDRAAKYFIRTPRDAVRLAKFHLEGLDGVPDVQRAIPSLKWAAERNNGWAMRILGKTYARGDGVEQDVEKGLAWLEKSVAAGDVPALIVLAKMYENGSGVEKVPEKALQYRTAAAKAGDPESMYRLGMALKNGEAVEPDPDAGREWLEAALAAGYEDGSQ